MLNHHPKLLKAHNTAKWRITHRDMPDIYSLDMRYKSSKAFVQEFGEHIEDSVKNLSLNEKKSIDNLIKMI